MTVWEAYRESLEVYDREFGRPTMRVWEAYEENFGDV